MIPDRRVISDRTDYQAVSLVDPSDRFTITAGTELKAKYELLDKIGYTINAIGSSDGFELTDADSGEFVLTLKSNTVESALNEALLYSKWKIQGSTELIGGSLGGGFGEVHND